MKKCQSHDQEKCQKECVGKCRPQMGCRGKCQKSASRPLACTIFIRGADPEAVSSALPRHPVWNWHFPKHSFQHFSWAGLWHFFRWSARSCKPRDTKHAQWQTPLLPIQCSHKSFEGQQGLIRLWKSAA